MAPMEKLFTFTVVIIPLFFLCFCSGCIDREREALLQFKAVLNDPFKLLSTWEKGSDCCQWEYIRCHEATHHVADVNIFSAGLFQRSVISESLCNLTFVERIELFMTRFTGTLPPCLGQLSSLVTLSLPVNSLSGNIPLSFANMSSLSVLDLRYNNFEGETLLSTICMLNLTNLSVVLLNDNLLNGSLPSCLGSLSSLTSLDLSVNQLTGSIPASFSNLSSLSWLRLANNGLIGNIPYSLGRASSLKRFDVSSNALSGSIPDSLGGLSSLVYLDLTKNQLNGTLPSTFSRLSSLTDLYAEWNRFNQSISSSALPSSLERLSLTLNGNQVISEAFFHNLGKLEELSLSNCVLNISTTWIPSFQLTKLHMIACKMYGQIPSWISTQFSLLELRLANSSLVGEIPSWLQDMKLQYINLTINHLEGRLLLNTSAWNLLRVLDVSSNAFSGQIPSSWPPNVQILLLNDNLLTGSIPPRLQDNSSLQVLNFANNHLSGIIPPSLGDCSELQMLNLGDNNLSGVMPSEFGKLSQLRSLVIRNNKVGGSVPSSISNCTKLYFLDVGQNLLEGQIPRSSGTLSELIVLAMRKNNLKGSIPAEIGQLKSLQILDLSSNHLSQNIPLSIVSLQAMMVELNQEFSKVQIVSRHITDYISYDYMYKNGLHMNSKGRDEYYTYIYPTMASIDLSDNQLKGNLPSDLGKLKGLKLLNLSMNNLDGVIPDSIVQMNWLESLDLSTNRFSGQIPLDLDSLSYLGALNFSNNNLSGSIPQGGHMTTFTKSSYSGNPNLWRCPLPKNFAWPELSLAPSPLFTSINEEGQNEEFVWYWTGVGLSYGAGFAAVVLFIVLRRKWGYMYFQGVDVVLKFCFPWFHNLALS